MLNFLKKIGLVIIELAIIAGLLLFIANKKGIENMGQIVPALQELAQQSVSDIGDEVGKKEAVFPVLEKPASKTFKWEFKGEKYSLTETFDQEVYNFYKAQPKIFSYSGELKPNWEEEYYGMFLKRSDQDKSISQLALDLQDLGKKHKLSDDQIVDLTLAFVQAIQYDDAKAKNILAKDGSQTMQYPYETLFTQLGVCSDKSLLAVSILREMGYGTAIFAYNDDNHMAIGIECPKNYSTYGSGYCYSETTSTGNKIGIIPSFDSESNKTVDTSALPDLNSSETQNAKIGQLGQVTMFQKTLGKQYSGIVQTQKIIAEIETLKKSMENLLPQIQSQKKTVAKEEKTLNDMKKELDAQYSSSDVSKYNDLVKKFNDYLENYKKDLKKLNNNIELYNKSTARYNILIKQ